MTVQVTDESAFSAGSLGVQVVFFVITGGIYGLYWMYKTAKQLDEATDASLSPILVIVPFYGVWMLSGGAEAATDQTRVLLFLLF